MLLDQYHCGCCWSNHFWTRVWDINDRKRGIVWGYIGGNCCKDSNLGLGFWKRMVAIVIYGFFFFSFLWRKGWGEVWVCEGLGSIYMWFSLSFSPGWDGLDQTLFLCGISIFCLNNVFFFRDKHTHTHTHTREWE